MTREMVRLDQLLVSRGLFPSRERAQAAVMAGEVRVGGRPAAKPGTRVDPKSDLEVTGGPPAYVSRGGLKLEKALQEFGVDLAGQTVLDVGASTGGFSDCALKQGAARVYAVDVGYGQLAWSLRQDPRVVSLERLNIRNLKSRDLQEGQPDLAVVDVSFISLLKVFPVLKDLDIPAVIALIKPQFEAGRGQVGRGGVVRDPDIHRRVLEEVAAGARSAGYHLQRLTYSPIKGPRGNIEYLALFHRNPPPQDPPSPDKIILAAHDSLKK
jgi:23S rRNA (cytidine1920-2'-O)/16S rRNA (cytidine1409-2'-O)-methyltransferase